jgi:SDR family mycofactocin-dependent oxidoreductase
VADTSIPRVALITGAARGIGAATARRLAADGYAVVAVDICSDDPTLEYPLGSRAELDSVVADCGPDAMAVMADVRDSDALDAAVAVAVDTFGGLDVAVAAAGVMSGGDVGWETSEAVWAVNMDVNLTGVWRTARAAMPAILDRAEPRSGRFVAIASAAGLGGHPTIAAYCAAKHGVIGLIQSLAVELGSTGVTANCVCPGSTASAILQASADVYRLDSMDEFAQHHPIGRILRPTEIASAVAWLCAEEQSGVTGIALPVDGGMTI